MWFIYALLATLMWGAADLFYKKSADAADKYSHLKTAMVVGFVMGAHAVITLIMSDVDYDFRNILIYLPVSSMYIISMTVGYLGLKYLELSVSSPVQNSSGAVTCLLCLIILRQSMDAYSAVAVALICAGVIMLGAFEKRRVPLRGEGKYVKGFAAILFPVIYCVIDALGTFFDAYYLEDFASTPLTGADEHSIELIANTSYELTFLICALAIFVFIRFVKRERISLPAQRGRALAALFETAGQFVYVGAMAGNAVIAAPLIASYSIVSISLSRIFLKEKLSFKQYAAVFSVLVGIIILGVVEGLAE